MMILQRKTHIDLCDAIPNHHMGWCENNWETQWHFIEQCFSTSDSEASLSTPLISPDFCWNFAQIKRLGFQSIFHRITTKDASHIGRTVRKCCLEKWEMWWNGLKHQDDLSWRVQKNLGNGHIAWEFYCIICSLGVGWKHPRWCRIWTIKSSPSNP